MGRTLNRYVVREMVGPFVFGVAAFTVVLLIGRMPRLIELAVNRGVSPWAVAEISAYILPAFLEVTTPMALLMAILTGFGRLSADGEALAMQTSGLSLYQMSRPVILLVLVSTVLTFFFALYARPWGNAALKRALYTMTKTQALAALQEKVFNTDFDGLVLYVEEIESPGALLRGVMVSDRRDPGQQNTIFANAGLILVDEEARALTLRLQDGAVHTVLGDGKDEPRTNYTVFTGYDVKL